VSNPTKTYNLGTFTQYCGILRKYPFHTGLQSHPMRSPTAFCWVIPVLGNKKVGATKVLYVLHLYLCQFINFAIAEDN